MASLVGPVESVEHTKPAIENSVERSFGTVIINNGGHVVAQLVEALRYEPGKSRFRFPVV